MCLHKPVNDNYFCISENCFQTACLAAVNICSCFSPVKFCPKFSFNLFTKHLIQLFVLYYFSQIVTCSTDKMLSLWDCTAGTRIRKYRGHQSFVNSCDIARRGPQLLCSASDDCTVRVSESFYFNSRLNLCTCIIDRLYCSIILCSVSDIDYWCPCSIR